MTSLRRTTAENWARAHAPVTDGTDEPLEPLDGTLPTSLEGTLFRGGPGRTDAYGTPYQHLFDGDGHACRFHFERGRVTFTNRYVRTREFVEELAAGRVLYRSFGTAKPGGIRANAFDPKFKNAANTTAFVHARRVYALWNRASRTSSTRARSRRWTGSTSTNGSWLRTTLGRASRAGRAPFSAHPRVDPATGALFNFGLANGPRQQLLLYELSADGAMSQPESHELDALYFVHDFSLTARFRVLLLCPARFGVVRTMLGVDTPLSGMQFDRSRPTRVWLCPRDRGQPIVIDAPPGFVFHHVNAFEDRDGTIKLHALRSDALPTLPNPRDVLANSVAPPRAELPMYASSPSIQRGAQCAFAPCSTLRASCPSSPLSTSRDSNGSRGRRRRTPRGRCECSPGSRSSTRWTARSRGASLPLDFQENQCSSRAETEGAATTDGSSRWASITTSSDRRCECSTRALLNSCVR